MQKKLQLATETLRVLEDEDLSLVLGGTKTGKGKCKGYGKTGKSKGCKGK